MTHPLCINTAASRFQLVNPRDLSRIVRSCSVVCRFHTFDGGPLQVTQKRILIKQVREAAYVDAWIMLRERDSKSFRINYPFSKSMHIY